MKDFSAFAQNNIVGVGGKDEDRFLELGVGGKDKELGVGGSMQGIGGVGGRNDRSESSRKRGDEALATARR